MQEKNHFFCNALIFSMIVSCQFKEFWHFLRKKQKKASFGLKEALSACVYIYKERARVYAYARYSAFGAFFLGAALGAFGASGAGSGFASGAGAAGASSTTGAAGPARNLPEVSWR